MAFKILLADDSMTAQNMGKKILTDAGYEVVAVSNGAAAVKKIAEHKPDLAVLDVYMPGYTGLEVCERLKGALDTTHMPVLLTVGRMEPFKPEEGSRVKADGIIIKPFEASDLLAAIQKLEQRLRRAVVAAVPADDGVSVHEKTQKIRIPYLDEFKDASYEEWKVAAGDQSGDGERDKGQAGSELSVPEAMLATPAMAMDELEIVPPSAHTTQRVTQPVEAPPAAPMRTGTTQLDPAAELAAAAGAPAAAKSTSGVWKALDKARDWFGGPTPGEPGAGPESTLSSPSQPSTDHIPGLPVGPAIDAPPATGSPKTVQEIAYEKTRAYGDLASQAARHAMPAMAAEELQHTAAAQIVAGATKDPHLEMVRSAELDGLEIAPEPGLEPTSSPKNEIHSEVAKDPALVTDSAALAGEFPTRFGVANADVVPVGIASDFPEMYGDAISAAGPEVEGDEPLESVAPVKDAEPRVAAAPLSSGWRAEEAPLHEHEHSLKLHDEMRQVYSPSGSPAEEEEVTEVELVEPEKEAAAQAARDLGSAPDPQLAAAMAAAVGAEVVPVVTHSLAQTAAVSRTSEDDENSSGHTALIADIVHRVTEMMKPELIRRIADELAKKKR